MRSSGLAESFRKVNYLIRPSKQVERMLFVDVAHRLVGAGYDVPNYTYVGLGSVYYADFVLFHKYLGMKNMICAEAAPIPKRMKFNKPYGFIDLRMRPISELIPELCPEAPHFVWLDYDAPLSPEIVQDVSGMLAVLCPGSLLLVTVEAEIELEMDPVQLEAEDVPPAEYFEEILEEHRAVFGRFVPREIQLRDLARNQYPTLLAKILRAVIQKCLISREPALEFHQLFNFRYRDTKQMFTLGGLLTPPDSRDSLASTHILDLDFVQEGEEPLEISVPPLTPREKRWLDSQIKRDGLREPREPVFELDRAHLLNYAKYYRHYPTFFEAVL